MNILYLGEAYNIKYISYPGKEAKVIMKDKTFCIYINNSWNAERQSSETVNALKRWFLREAHRIINERLVHYSNILKLNYNDVRIKEQKTRWGSCSQKGNLNFNWRLVMAPLWILDYVVIHELCHIKHLNHSKDFWDMVELYYTNCKEAKAWLKANGGRLITSL